MVGSIGVGGGGAGGALPPPPPRLVQGVEISGKILGNFIYFGRFCVKILGNFIFFGQICVKILCNFMSFGQFCPQNVESVHPDERLCFWRSPQFGQKKQLICRAKFKSFSSHFSGESLVPPPNHFELLRPWLEAIYKYHSTTRQSSKLVTKKKKLL